MNETSNLKPMPLWLDLLMFGIPGILIFIGSYYGVQYTNSIGVPLVTSFPFFLFFPVYLVGIGAIIAYQWEGNELSINGLKERFRLKKIQGKDWFWVLMGALFVIFFDFVLGDPLTKLLLTFELFQPPEHFPALFNPLMPIFPFTEFLGVELKGNWLLLISTIIIHNLAMFSEEIMWRGYILPREELKYGKWAFVVNGLLWGYLVHMILKWGFISFLPSMLLTPWIAQKLKNTTASFLVHAIGNSPLWILILIGVLGVSQNGSIT